MNELSFARHFRALWRTLSQAALYPFHFQSATTILFGALFLWLFSTSLFGLFIVLAVSTALVHFLFLNLRHSALGGIEPPAITANEFLRFGGVPFLLLVTVVVWSGLVAQAEAIAAFAGTVLAIAGFALLPAFATLLVLEESLSFALHPARLLRFAWRGGITYLLLAAVLGAFCYRGVSSLLELATSDGFAGRLIFSIPQAKNLLWLLAGLYLATVFSHVLGKLAWHAHDFDAPRGHTIDVMKSGDTDSAAAIASQLADLLRKDDRNAVLKRWEALAERDRAFHVALLSELLHERAWGLVPVQAQQVVSRQLAENRHVDALTCAMHTLKDFESFRTATADEWLALCRIARDTGRGDWLKVLATKAADRFSRHAALVEIALVHAQHVADRENNIEDAMAILQPHLDSTDHPRHSDIRRLRDALQPLRNNPSL